jgi:hypothetical protein
MAVVSGGTTLIDNGALDSAVPTGALILLQTQTASSSSSVSFTSNIDSTYKAYVFKFIDIHPATNNSDFEFNFSIDSGSNYNVTKTSTHFQAYHLEDGSASGLNYQTSEDLAQSTAFQTLSNNVGNDNDQSTSGNLFIYNPSSTTFVKHFIGTLNNAHGDNYQTNYFVAGYGNTTSAIDAIQFKMSSGNIDSGVIKLYGIK